MSTISKIDQYVINKVKFLREKNNISQSDLSIRVELSEGFVGHVENPKRRDKYNLNHLNTLAQILKCSPKDFLPENPIISD